MKASSKWLLLIFVLCFNAPLRAQTPLPQARVLPTDNWRLPGGRFPEAGIDWGIDCNSPLHWDAAGNLYLFSSVQHPFRSAGIGLLGILEQDELPTSVELHSALELAGGVWLEATYRAPDGTLY